MVTHEERCSQGCVLSLYLFNVSAEMVIRETLDGFHGGIQIEGWTVTNLRYADDIVLLATTQGFIQALLFYAGERIPSPKKESLNSCLLYTSPSPRDGLLSRMPSSA